MVIVESYQYIGPNRRSQRTAIEQVLQFQQRELEALSALPVTVCQQLADVVRDAGFSNWPLWDMDDAPADPRGSFALLYGHICIQLQQLAGHRVSEMRQRGPACPV
jgi:hypothetical protein